MSAYVDLTGEEVAYLERASTRTQPVEARTDVICEGETPTDVHLVVSWLAGRYKLLEDGRRQIVAFLIPGDFCDLDVFILSQMDHTIAALQAVEMVWLAREQRLELMSFPNISRAMWLTSLGRGDAARVDHQPWGNATRNIASRTFFANCTCG